MGERTSGTFNCRMQLAYVHLVDACVGELCPTFRVGLVVVRHLERSSARANSEVGVNLSLAMSLHKRVIVKSSSDIQH